MGYNKVIVMGNMTRAIEVRATNSGTKVGQFAVAVNRKFGDKEETTFVDVTAWGKTAEIIEQYAGKGSQVLVEGRLSCDSWEDRATGQKRTKLFVTAESVQLCGSRGDSAPQDRPSSQMAQPQPTSQMPPDFPPPSGAPDDDIPW